MPGGGNDCDNGLLVEGDGVTFYGLAVEHTLKDLTKWSGEDGRTIFYQSELPCVFAERRRAPRRARRA